MIIKNKKMKYTQSGKSKSLVKTGDFFDII